MKYMKGLFFDENSDAGGGNSQTTGQTTGTTGQTTGVDTAAAFKAELAKYQGDLTRMAEKQFDRIYQLRQRAQEAEAKIPKENQVIISAENETLLKKYKQIGSIEDLETSGAELGRLKKYQMVSKAAAVAQMNPTVLSKLLPADAVLEIGDAKDDDGNAVQTVTVKNGDAEKPLSEYAETNWSDFLPALKAAGAMEQDQGRPWIQQSGSVSSGAGNKGKQHPAVQATIDAMKEEAKPIAQRSQN